MRRFLVKKTGDCGSPPTTKKPKADSERLAAAREYEDRRRRGFKAAWRLSLPASSAECERGFSAMKLIKTDVRNRLTVNVLTDVLRIKLMSPSISDFEPTDAIHAWNVTSLTQTKLPNV